MMRFVFAVTILAISASADAQHWPSFRGPGASGIAEGKAMPVSWDVETGTNVRWKIDIPGLSHSSPVVWGDRLFVTAAVSSEGNAELRVGLYGDIKPVDGKPVHDWKVFCFDTNSGEIIWERTAHTGVPVMKRHTKSTHANSTPATDGKHVVAFFASEGLYCYDMEGELLWKKDVGPLDSGFYMVRTAQWGFASSPVIHDGKIILQIDVQEDSFLAALDVKTGEEIWRTARDDVPTWSTPTVHSVGGQARILINGYRHTGGYDLRTGEEVWFLEGGGDIPVPTPFVAHDLIFMHSAHGRYSPIYAIREDARGEITLADGATSNDAIVWSVGRGGAYMSTSIVYGDYLYNCAGNGRLTCYDAKTGEVVYEERLGGTGVAFSASPVASDGKLYFPSEEKGIFVVEAGPEFNVLAQNGVGDVCMASPAISDGTLYLKTQHFLIAVSLEE